MDKVTENILQGYARDAGIPDLQEHRQFEHFVTHIVLSKIYGGNFSSGDFLLGDGEQGVDAFAILVNGSLVNDTSHLEEVLAEKRRLQVELVFIQAKTSSKIELAPFGVFADAVADLIKDKGQATPGLENVKVLLENLWSASGNFSQNPIVRLFYITTSNSRTTDSVSNKSKKFKQEVLNSNQCSEVSVEIWGAKEVQEGWRSIANSLKAEIVFASKATLPEIPGVDEAYLGVLPAVEFMKLITDDKGEMRKALFYDNVRDFQGEVDVNQDIMETLRSGEGGMFCVLNNGVTVVARSLKTTGNRFTLEDYQVVNGCQTSHILYQGREFLNEVNVPFRLIVTSRDEVAQRVTIATNKQSQVSKESLLALGDVQKGIEEYFNTYKPDDEKRVYYERRSKQWSGSPAVRGAWRVISLRNLLQSFSSIYHKTPHTAARYYNDLRDRAEEVFNSNHHPAYFYTAAYAYCKLDQFFRNDQIDRKFKPARYHLLAAVRAVLTGSCDREDVKGDERAAEKHLAPFNELIWEDKKYLELLNRISAVIDAEAGGEISREFVRASSQTEKILRRVLKEVNL